MLKLLKLIILIATAKLSSKMKILILNGPNLNLIGRREPEIYGTKSFDEFIDEIRHKFSDVEIDYRQSNHEGILIDVIQESDGVYDGIVFNPGAYAHTSIALADAIRSVKTPVVEVHLSNIYEREEFRRRSFTAEACVSSIVGRGMSGYEDALDTLLRM